MKKYALPGLTSLLAVLALSLPLAAHAQTSPTLGTPQAPDTNLNTNPQTSTPYSMQQNQNPTTAPSSSGVSQQTQMNTNMNANQQTTTQTTVGQSTTTTTTSQISQTTMPPSSGEVIVGADSASSIVPPLTIGMGTTSITVVNPTPKPVTFTVPNLNLTYEVPGNSVRTVQIDQSQTASLTPGQTVAYYINDSSGNQIASSNFNNNQTIVSQINTNTQVATEETKSEPTYTSTHPSSSRRSVRGFW